MARTGGMAEHSPRVLVADDEPGIRDALVYALEAAGFRVKACPDGLAAWEAFAGGAFDLAILDIMMPRLDGLELLKRMRAAGAELPVLLLTSRDEEFDRVLGLELGADDYITKPFNFTEVLARIRVVLRTHDLIKQIENREQRINLTENLMDTVRESSAKLKAQIGRLAEPALAAGDRQRLAGELLQAVELMDNSVDSLRSRSEGLSRQATDLKALRRKVRNELPQPV
ncbi:MAG TPA: hypothetical protein DCQ73_07045 [Spirochaetaceae bacterium]|nr:hypothetical protein [Spirochaetaceae bacterium]